MEYIQNIMDFLIAFFKSDAGISISWICTVFSTIYALYSKSENSKLKVKIKNMKIENNTNSKNETITQNGSKNIYTKNNSGGMNINM